MFGCHLIYFYVFWEKVKTEIINESIGKATRIPKQRILSVSVVYGISSL